MPAQQITILGSAFPLRGGGIATFNERLAYAFQEAGHSVEIITFSLQYPSILFPGKTQYSEESAPPGLLIKVLVNSINPINWVKVGLQLKKSKPDILIIRYWIPFMGPCLGTIARITKRNKHTKIIAIVDNLIPHEKRPGDSAFSRYFTKSCDAFLTMSRKVLSELSAIDSTKPKIYTPHPLYDNFGAIVDKSEAQKYLRLDPLKHYILFFGFIRDYKGLDILLEAMGDNSLAEMNVHLIVAGEFYSSAEPYYKIVKDLDLDRKVTFFSDFIPNDLVKYYFSSSDLVVQPYKNATQSGVTQIAYHFNIPMITTNVGGLSEMVPDGHVGFVTSPDKNEIASAIFKFFNDNKEAEFKANCEQFKQHFTWNRFIEKILELNNLVKRSNNI
jgi:D-inositol-3-phosphate glycosyltransferase